MIQNVFIIYIYVYYKLKCILKEFLLYCSYVVEKIVLDLMM